MGYRMYHAPLIAPSEARRRLATPDYETLTPGKDPAEPESPELQFLSASDRSDNELRPHLLAEMVGQERLKPLLRRVIDVALETGRTLDHLLLDGASGTGKTTVAHVVANELGRNVLQVDAPVTQDMLLELREKLHDGDVLFIDEIHRQVAADRRGVSAACQPEIFYHVLEDKRLATARGMLPFPDVTVIGATTDIGLLPEPFLGRFPLRPKLDKYTWEEMSTLAARNAAALGLTIELDAQTVLAQASRANPRQLNQYIRNCQSLAAGDIDIDLAREVVEKLNSTSLDGLTLDMQRMLTFLYTSGRRVVKGETRYQASVNTIATALGRSRDSKAVALFVEPWLIEKGYVQVAQGGRILTPAGVERARRLTEAT